MTSSDRKDEDDAEPLEGIPSTAHEAQLFGLTTYLPNHPCRRGHRRAFRWTASRSCVLCNRLTARARVERTRRSTLQMESKHD